MDDVRQRLICPIILVVQPCGGRCCTPPAWFDLLVHRSWPEFGLRRRIERAAISSPACRPSQPSIRPALPDREHGPRSVLNGRPPSHADVGDAVVVGRTTGDDTDGRRYPLMALFEALVDGHDQQVHDGGVIPHDDGQVAGGGQRGRAPAGLFSASAGLMVTATGGGRPSAP